MLRSVPGLELDNFSLVHVDRCLCWPLAPLRTRAVPLIGSTKINGHAKD